MDRVFFAADNDRSIHGEDLSSDATLRREFTLDQAVPSVDILTWYLRRLEAAGWADPYKDDSLLTVHRGLDGIRHVYQVTAQAPEGERSTDKYVVRYSMTYDGG